MKRRRSPVTSGPDDWKITAQSARSAPRRGLRASPRRKRRSRLNLRDRRYDRGTINVCNEDREKAWLAVLLAWVAGFVDAVGYVLLFRLFIAHMSGNSAAMGAHFGQGEWGEAFYRAFPIPVFVLGVIAGAALNEAASRRGVRSLFSLTLSVEAALLFLFMICGEGVIRGGVTGANLAWE